MRETRVLLLRHAETSAPGFFHGAESDIGLGERGILQANAVAQHLAPEQPSALYCSAMKRAIDTAQPIASACGLTPRIEPDLHERKMGPLSGQSRDDGFATYATAKARWIAGQVEYSHEGGESYAAIARRVLPVFLRITVENAGQTVVVVAHGVVIRVLLTSLLPGRDHADFDAFAIDNAAFNDLRFDGRTWTALALNQRPMSDIESLAW